ncbi:putative Hydroxyproline-rich glycoprotein family protein [Hibiscus syriacus]|uniref:Hydroxyproline-rich glycoprotein family protein n=1 Tax=Hibiscus syriacus TaxID=106335 RepID=A0A6A3BT93_HIBSY|nr:YDG domain-containing protein At5g47160-like [Hibiscus syriacus]KAE8719171.1 putative Hydroxyproline-rich glycoprotein family protein [Hibiscus syriacus]
MVGSNPKPVKEGPFSKPKQAKHVHKNVRLVKGHHPQEVCSEKEKTFVPEWYKSRENINGALKVFRRLLVNKQERDMIAQEHGLSPEARKCNGIWLHIRVAKLMEVSGQWVNTTGQIGCISGIQIGHEFHWRGELSIVGLHNNFHRGIDVVTSVFGKTWATSIVDSGRFDNARVSSDEITYCGEGDNPCYGKRNKHKDQTLDGRNLALINNMNDKTPVRVIRKYTSIVGANDSGYKFVYEGLYQVTGYEKKRGEFGKYVYEFKLVKLEDCRQYDSKWKMDVRAHRHQV